METIEIHPKILYYGTPVALVCTENEDATFNLAPMSSSWALGYTLVLGFGATSQTFANLAQRPQLSVNFPSPELVDAVESLAPLTGRTHRRKFETCGLTPTHSSRIRPPRVSECPLQFEAEVVSMRRLTDDVNCAAVEARVLAVFAHSDIVEGVSHIDVTRWHPLLYVYRHYFGRGAYLKPTFRAETPAPREGMMK